MSNIDIIIEAVFKYEIVILFIMGTTGVGKSTVARKIAERVQKRIVECEEYFEIAIYGDRTRESLRAFLSYLGFDNLDSNLLEELSSAIDDIKDEKTRQESLKLVETLRDLQILWKSTFQLAENAHDLIERYGRQCSFVSSALYGSIRRSEKECQKILYLVPCVNVLPASESYKMITRSFKTAAILFTVVDIDEITKRIKMRDNPKRNSKRYDIERVNLVQQLLIMGAIGAKIPILPIVDLTVDATVEESLKLYAEQLEELKNS